MNSRFPRWLIITGIVVLVAALVFGIVMLFRSGWMLWGVNAGWFGLGLLIAIIAVVLISVAPSLIRLYKFQKYFKTHEAQLHGLPALMQSGRTQEALMRFESVMKHAPDSAYIYYMRAFFLQAAGKLPEALTSAKKAISLAANDPLLPATLQQVGGQMGQPTTVEGFKEQLEELRRSLEPRVNQMRERREKAAKDRKKKSR